ncbi:hypothetical protein VD0003_g6345 [Verticillium dahliae]|nr:hypothetical protein VD0003_g6345 [Verticillium dahliae]
MAAARQLPLLGLPLLSNSPFSLPSSAQSQHHPTTNSTAIIQSVSLPKSLSISTHPSRPLCLSPIPTLTMTRSHKYNDRDHAGLADGTAAPQEHLPRYFAKHGHEGVDPKKMKKSGGGKANWGNAGDEIVDEDFSFANPRRRSNSTGYANQLLSFRTKFDVNEPEPVFEESLHGPTEDDVGAELAKTETSESDRSSEDGKSSQH